MHLINRGFPGSCSPQQQHRFNCPPANLQQQPRWILRADLNEATLSVLYMAYSLYLLYNTALHELFLFYRVTHLISSHSFIIHHFFWVSL